MTSIDNGFQIGDVVTWTYIPKKTAKKDMEDSPEYARLRNIEMHGKGPFTISGIMPNPRNERIALVEIQDKNGNKTQINKSAFKKYHHKK